MEMPSLRRSQSETPISCALSGLGVRLEAVLGDGRLHHAVLDHQRIVEHGHLGHAAIGVAGVDIGAEQRILLRARRRIEARRHQVAIGAHDPIERAPRPEGIDQDAHRHAGRAGVAIGHVGDVLAAPEPAFQKIVDEEGRLLPGQMREELPLELTREVRAGLRGGDVELWKVALMLCHGPSTRARILASPQSLVERRRLAQMLERARIYCESPLSLSRA